MKKTLKKKQTNLWSFHGVMLRKIHLKLVGLIGIKSSWSSIDFNHPPSQNSPTKKKKNIFYVIETHQKRKANTKISHKSRGKKAKIY